MNSTLRIALILGLLVALVFGVTFISQFKGTDPTKTGDDPNTSGGFSNDPPLVFGSSQMRYDPFTDNPAHRNFNGFYEVGQKEMVGFWFQNRNPAAAQVAVRGRSCTQCTHAWIAAIPDAAMRKYLERQAVGMFPVSPLPVPDLLTVVAAAELLGPLVWTEFNFDDPSRTATVPAAAADGFPSWGILKTGFEVRAAGPKQLGTAFAAKLDAAPAPSEYKFEVMLEGMPAFDVTPAAANVGELPEGARPKPFEVIAWSATREAGPGQDQFQPPVCRVLPDDRLVAVGPPVPLSPADRLYLADAMLAQDKRLVRVRGGYRIPVTVSRDGPGGQPDLGRFERDLAVAPATGNGDTRKVGISGVVTGPVRMADDGPIRLGDFPGRQGVAKRVEVLSDRTDVDLEVVKAECSPRYLNVEIESSRVEVDRKYFAVKVSVPANAAFGTVRDGVVVFRTKGPNPQKIRVAVTGNGYLK